MEFDIKLTPEAQRNLDNLAKAGKIDLRPTLNILGISYRKEVELVYAKQQPRAEGLRWAPLSEKYAEWKSRRYPGAPLLVRTGRLYESMTQKGAQGNIDIISKGGARFGSSISYGVYHDQGTRKMPKRNFSEPSDRRRNIWIEQIRKDIVHNFEVNGIEVKGEIFAS